MSGVELAGLVLGALPLLVSSLEHYDNIVEPIKRYRKYSTKVRDLHDTLSLERTIFRAQCVLLLSPNITKTEAERMLENPAHHLWRDEAFGRRIDQCFGSLGYAMKEVMGSMIVEMGRMAVKLKEFDVVAGTAQTGHSSNDNGHRSSVRTKIKFALSSHASMWRDLESLTKLNERFVRLSSQIIQLENLWYPSNNTTQTKSNSDYNLQSFKQMRMASIDLFGAFVVGCHRYHRHFLRFALDGISTKSEAAEAESRVQFNVCYCSCHESDDVALGPTALSNTKTMSMHDGEEYKLLIESTSISQLSTPTQSPGSIDNGKSKSISDDNTVARTAAHAAMNTANTEIQISTRRRMNDLFHPEMQIPRQGQMNNLCHQLTRYGANTSSLGQTSQLLVLHGDGSFKHNVLLKNQSARSESKVSLADVLVHVKKDGRHFEIPQYQRLCVAATLGSRVLQLYGTPWMAHALDSNKLYFLGELGDVSEITNLGYTEFEPGNLYTDIQLESRAVTSLVDTGGVGPSTMTTTSQPSRFGLQTGPMNSWLYHLGILLIELAYHVPFTDLLMELKDEYQTLSIPLPTNPKTAEYQLACQLAENIGSTLGARYARIVRRCLRCDFDAISSNLNNDALHRSVYENVVQPLRDLENGFRTLQAENVA